MVDAGEVQQQGDDHAGAVAPGVARHQERSGVLGRLGQGAEDGGDVRGIALQADAVELAEGPVPAEIHPCLAGRVDQRQ
ncbi:hypothetical protein [Blastococcus sp. TF02-09]|uniref:hypothetical protein n=1 Tax=Blastococcus sp. TF02-09 TaxID=2250576 RepID=UPI001F2371B0|nr:hypothetical protein [Blastococcus sp. TF02-9]